MAKPARLSKSDLRLLAAPESRRDLAALGFEERARAVVSSAWAAAWKPRERLPPDEWADAHFRLSDKAGASAGRWSTSVTPYLREVLRCYADPTVRQITFMSGSQLGKTSVVLICMAYTVDCDPQPTIFVLPDKDLVKSINKDRVLPTFRGTPAVARHMTGRAWDEKNTQINFDTMTVWYAWSGSRASMASRAIGRVFGDEIDEWQDIAESIDRTRQRTKTFPDPKEVYTSTPTYEGVGIHREYELGDQREYHVPCPHADCGCYQTLKFPQIRWPVPDGALRVHADPTVAEKHAWYECEVCGKPIDHAEKSAMLARGVWAKKGEKVRKDGVVEGEPARPGSGHASFRLNSLYSPFPQMTWGRLARQFLEYHGHPPMAWINGELGEPMREAGESADARAIIAAAKEDAPDYTLGTAPPGTQALVLTIDVQSDHVYYLVTAWAVERYSEWCGLVDADRLECPEVPLADGVADARAEELVINAWAQVERQLRAVYPVQGATDGRGAPLLKTIALVGCDSNYRTEEVLRFCRRNHVYAMLGRGARQVHTPHEEKMVDRLNDGRPLAGGVRQVIHNVDMFKDWAYRNLVRRAPVPGYMRLPTDLGKKPWIAEQLTAEHRVEEPGSRGMTRLWKPRKTHNANHLWDGLVMAHTLADRYLIPQLKARAAAGARAAIEGARAAPGQRGAMRVPL